MRKCKEALSNEHETRMQACCDTAPHHPFVLVGQPHVLVDVVTAQYAGILPQILKIFSSRCPALLLEGI